jgi:hypothetical protein
MDKQSKTVDWASGLTSAIVGLVAACTVCCAPLVAPLIAALLTALGIGAYLGHTLIALVGAAIGIVFWRLKSRSRQCKADSPSCACTSNQG